MRPRIELEAIFRQYIFDGDQDFTKISPQVIESQKVTLTQRLDQNPHHFHLTSTYFLQNHQKKNLKNGPMESH